MFKRFSKAWLASFGTAVSQLGFLVAEAFLQIDISNATEISVTTVIVGLLTALGPANAPA